MNNSAREVGFSQQFLKSAKRLEKKYRRIGDDVEGLIKLLESGETPGDRLINVGLETYKVRLASRDMARGKSGGFRVIYYLKQADKVILLIIYAKTEQSDIRADEVAALLDEYEAEQDEQANKEINDKADEDAE
jgi:mRNA-degrading endonuclease RelE of RelBE toxin-antitoxin system